MKATGYISYERAYKLQKSVIESFNCFVSNKWGKFTTEELNIYFLETRASYIKNYTKSVKHNKVRESTLNYINGYVDGVRAYIESKHTVWVYKIFGKYYGCFERDPFPKYDKVFPREVWTHPDFPSMGMKIWTGTKNEFYGYKKINEDLPKFPCMVFSAKNGVVSIRIKQNENDPPEKDTIGTFPVMVGHNIYVDLMNTAKAYNVSPINMEEI